MTLGPLRFTNASGGTSDWVYPGPTIDLQSPASAQAVDGTTYLIYAEALDRSQWEIATGAYTASSKTFARTTIIANSLGTTAKINFGNPPQVAVYEIGALLAAKNLSDVANAATARANIGVDYATKSDQQTGTAASKTVVPAHQQDHPSAAKAWVAYQGTGTPAILASYNVGSVTRNSAGNYTINWTVPFASANYAVVGTSRDNTSGAASLVIVEGAPLAGSVTVLTINPSSLAVADTVHLFVVAFGTQ